MREFHHGVRLGRLAVASVTLATSISVGGPVAAAPPSGLEALRACPPGSPGRIVGRPRTPRIRVEDRLGPSGALTGTNVRIGRDVAVRLGPRGFADGPFGGAAIVGERSRDETRLVALDLWRRCAMQRLTVPGLVYGSRLDVGTGVVHLSLVEPGTRRELGIWAADPEAPGRLRLEVAPPTGDLATATPRSGEIDWDGGPVGRWCAAGRCEERRSSGRLQLSLTGPDAGTIDASAPLVSPRPVPEEPAPRWPRDRVLTYRWHATETPPSWIRPAVDAAAEDVARSRRSRTPTFRYDAAAPDAIRYTSVFPTGSCSTAIACASYVIGESWTVRIRPHRTDFRWGTLRWCQADDRDGCFDVERIMLHELGHIVGIDHPETAGFSLRPLDTVMHMLAPARPKAGSGMHVFGPCDVATLQERYDVPGPTTAISSCNDVNTTLSLTASSASVVRGTRVTLVAELRIPDRDAYGRLGGNALSGRSIQLWRRPLGAVNTAWTVFWMRSGDSPATYVLSLQPSISYEFQAVFAAPASEGLNDSASPIVTVRVVDGCGTSTCLDAEDPMS